MGNVFNLEAITAFCEKHNLWLMEDCCDALGAKYNGKHVGTFGDIATFKLLSGASHYNGRRRSGIHVKFET